jgi:signal transduction histidine kinase
MRGRPFPCDDHLVTTSPPPAAPPAPVAPPSGPPAGPPARRLYRASSGRVLGGVCRGLAQHLGVDVVWVRAAFVLLAVSGGAGLAMYAAFWVLAPLRVEAEEPEEAAGAGGETGYLVALGAVAVGALLLLDALGVGLPMSLAWPVVVAGLGVVILWRQADDAQRDRWRPLWAGTDATRWAGAARALLGLALVVGGLAVFLAGRNDTSGVTQVVVAVLVVVAGIVLISGPWWLRMARELAAERAARIREQERAEIAAHVHDSVLHTLTLIQRHVEDPREVTRLARAQERELRTWLYRPVADPDTTLTAAIERAAAQVEDAHGVAVDVVVVGDVALDDRLRAMLLATREALVNAAKYAGGAPISVYAEVEPDQVTVFVRDRGPGFELAAVPEDRLGVRQSVIGRMARNGGRATVRSTPGEGTEVALEMPVSEGARRE